MSPWGAQNHRPVPPAAVGARLLAAAAVGLLALTAAACRVPSRYDEADHHRRALQSPWDLAFEPDGGVLLHRARRQHQLRHGDGQRAVIGQPGRRRRPGRGRDDGHRRRSRLRHQPPHLHLLHDGDRRARRALQSSAGNADRSTAARPIVTGIQRAHERPALRLPHPRSVPTATLWITTGDAADRHQPAEPQRRSTARCCASTTDGAPGQGNMDINGRTSVDLRLRLPQPAGHLVPPGDGWPFLIEHGSDRDDEITPIDPGGNGGWNPGPGYNESVPMTDFNLGPTWWRRSGPRASRRSPRPAARS